VCHDMPWSLARKWRLPLVDLNPDLVHLMR
jgi:hypothetical protein